MNNIPATRLTLYAFISAIETDLRRFISFNTNDIMKESIFDSVLLRRLKDRMKRNNDFDESISNLILYLDFGDCICLINKMKSFFPQKFIKELDDLTSNLEKIIVIRNRVMHSRPLEFEDFPTVCLFLDGISKYSVLDWDNTIDVKEKIKKDPSVIFGIRIPDFSDQIEERIIHNLPPAEFDDTGYIGRDKDIEQIKKKLYGNYPVISIIGDGGIGKTALLLKCLYDLIDDLKQPYDAIIWVSLKTKVLNNGEFKNIDNTITTTLDIYKEIKDVLIGDVFEDEDIDVLIKNIQEYMSEFHILLVLDNLETINTESIREFLLNIPAGSKLVITSRIGIGEFETRYILEGLNKKESIFYLKRLAQNNQIKDILNTPDNQLDEICKHLHSNPLAIKWFVANIFKGEPIESVLSHTNDLTSYCMSNVYDKLSKDAKNVLDTLLIYNKETTDAELVYLLNSDAIIHRKALNELMTTNMIRMKSVSENGERKSLFSITDFAKEYLQQHCKPTNDTFLNINKRIKTLKGLSQNLNLDIDINPYDPKALTYSSKKHDEIIAAYSLKQALVYSGKQDFNKALEHINRAKDIAPTYHEVYKIAGFINASHGNYYTADREYQTAIQCKADSSPLLFLYAGFKMRFLEDFDDALELTIRAENLDKNNINIKLQKARLYMFMNRFEESNVLFQQLLSYNDSTIKIKKISVDLAAENLRRWAEKCNTEGKLLQSISLLKEAIVVIESLDKHERDSKIITTLCRIVFMIINCCKSIEEDNNECIRLLINTLEKYGKKIRFSDKYSDVIRGINSLYPRLSTDIRKQVQIFVFEDIKAMAKKIEENDEGIIIEKYSTYGFICNNTYPKLFFYWTDYEGEFSQLNIGDRVRFSLGENAKGICGKQINLVKKYDDSISA